MPKMVSDRLTSGIPGLDKLMEGGFVKNSVNLVAGQTGTGKTIFGMQYILEGLRSGSSCVYLTLEQRVEDILADMAKFGWDKEFEKYIAQGKLIVASHTPTDIKDLESVTFQFLKKISATRFVLDSISIATMGWKVSSMDVGKIRSEIYSYMMMLKNAGVTSLLITEIPEGRDNKISRFGFEEFLSDGVIILNYLQYAAGGTPRSCMIRKMRRTDHGTDIYPMKISGSGITIAK